MTTKLDIVNSCLQSIGENPVTDADSEHPSAIAARSILERNDRAIQMRGWWYNREYRLRLLPNQDGEIVLPSNTLKVRPSSTCSHLIKRGNRLYDPVRHTYDINQGVTPSHGILVTLIVQLDIEDLPESAGDYLMKDTTEKFYVSDDGDPDKAKALKADSQFAWVELKKEDLTASRTTSNTTQIHRQLWSRLNIPTGSGSGSGYWGGPNDPDLDFPGGGIY